jgi:hypothetical protein
MQPASRSASSHDDSHVQELERELEQYRQATEDALQQLDWCIGYLHGCGKRGIANALSGNRSYTRRHIMQRPEEPVPTQVTETSATDA